MPGNSPGNSIFISYAHADPSEFVDELERHLKVATRLVSGLEVWTDDRIEATESWQREIENALHRSVCAILLISARFLDSDYIYDGELPFVLARARDDEQFALLPVFVSKVPKRSLTVEFDYRGKPTRFDLASIQGHNGPDTPLDQMQKAECTALFAGLADDIATRLEALAPKDSQTPDRVLPPSRPPPSYPAEARPQIVVQLERWGGRIQRRLWLTQGAPPLDRSKVDARGEMALDDWEPCLPFDGEQLLPLLLGDDLELRTELADKVRPGDAAPMALTSMPLRVRLLTGDPTLRALPWSTISHGGVALSEHGWSVELSPQLEPDAQPSFVNQSFAMPGPILVAFSRPLFGEGHLDDVRGLLRAIWPKRVALFEAHDLESLELELAERTPRLVYYFGSGRWDCDTKSYCLEISTRGGERAELPVNELLDKCGPRAPQVVFLNVIDDQGCRCVADAEGLTVRSKAVITHCTSQQSLNHAREVGYRWLEHLLRHRRDPVTAFHHAGARCGGCWTAYETWRNDSVAHHDEDLVEYFLDRHEQSEHLLGACGELVNRDSPLRVQFRLVVGERGNRVSDFARQAELYLAENSFAGVHCFTRGPVYLHRGAGHSGEVDLCYRRHFRLMSRDAAAAALRARGIAHSGEMQVPLLCWCLEPDAEWTGEHIVKVATASLEWSWETLSIDCPDDLRIISLVFIESEDSKQIELVRRALRDHERSLRDRTQDQRVSFRFRDMRPLAGVDENHLRDYFLSPTCWCWDNLRGEFPRLLLGAREQMPFDEAVRQIKDAKRMGWGAKADILRKRGAG